MKKNADSLATPATPTSPGGDVPEATPAELSLHNNFVASARALRRGMTRTLYYLLAVKESRVYETFGFGSVEAYAEHFGGLAPRTVKEMLTLARRMRRVPALANAVQLGKLTWRKALLISREAMKTDSKPLIELAEDLSVRELKALTTTGSLPAPVRRKPAVPAAAAGKKRGPGDGSAPRVATGGTDLVAPEPSASRDSRGNGKSQESSRPGVVEGDSRCDRGPGADHAVFVTLKMTPEQFANWEAATAGHGPLVERALAAMAPARAAAARHLVVLLHCASCSSTELVTSRGELPARPSLLERALCDGIIEDRSATRRAAVSPRKRRAALRRARYQCEAVGCRHTLWLEIHHRVPASRGGGESLENLVVLCSRCHRAIHERERSLRETVAGEP